MFLKLLQHPSNGFHVLLAFAFGINEDVIEIYYYKNVKLLCQDLIDVILKRGRCIGQSKRHNLVLEVAIAGPEDRLLFVAFPDLHLMVGLSQIKLGEMSSPNLSIQ